MAFPRIGGPGSANLGIGPLAYTSIGGPTALTNAVTLQAGQVWEFPSGTYMVFPGAYTFLQQFDPVSRIWRNMPTITGLNFTIDSDGDNVEVVDESDLKIAFQYAQKIIFLVTPFDQPEPKLQMQAQV